VLTLHIGRERTTIGDAELAVGRATLARSHFRHEPPTPLEIEEAIAAIEDMIAAARPARAAHAVARDAVVRDIALDAGVSPGAKMVLARDAVEQAFERSLRRPPDNERMAALLILRELMHHLDIETLEAM